MSLVLPLGTVASSLSGQFATVFVFVIVGFVFAGIALGVAKVLRPHNPFPGKLATYECGEEPVGSSWVRFNVRFYLVALFFIVFDVEVVFLYPWAVVFKQLYPLPKLGSLVFWEMVLFLTILSVGLAYIWVKGDLDWVKKLVERPAPGEESPAPGLLPEAEEEVPAP
jgi:NADH-quinone oxidoreductase subunit A